MDDLGLNMRSILVDLYERGFSPSLGEHTKKTLKQLLFDLEVQY